MEMSICICSHCVQQYYLNYKYLKNETDSGYYFSKNMHLVWFGSFVDKFQPICNATGKSWSLIPSIETPNHIFKHTERAKVRFTCRNCENVWTSMYGTVIFYVYEEQCFILSYKLLGQKCTKCYFNEFEYSIWYPEEVERVLENISKILLNLENQAKPNRVGNPKGSHKPEYCQACEENICQHATSRSRLYSANFSLQEYGQTDVDDDDDEEEEKDKKKEENNDSCQNENDELTNFTSDYESELEFGMNLETSCFRRSLSMPAKSVVDALFL